MHDLAAIVIHALVIFSIADVDLVGTERSGDAPTRSPLGGIAFDPAAVLQGACAADGIFGFGASWIGVERPGDVRPREPKRAGS